MQLLDIHTRTLFSCTPASWMMKYDVYYRHPRRDSTVVCLLSGVCMSRVTIILDYAMRCPHHVYGHDSINYLLFILHGCNSHWSFLNIIQRLHSKYSKRPFPHLSCWLSRLAAPFDYWCRPERKALFGDGFISLFYGRFMAFAWW